MNPFAGLPTSWLQRGVDNVKHFIAEDSNPLTPPCDECDANRYVPLGSLRMLVGEQTRRARTKSEAA